MNTNTSDSFPEELLAHADWLRAVARRLVSDESHADDVLQQTWLAVLRKPPEPGRGAARWLEKTLRNFAYRIGRDAKRRRSREIATARSVRVGSTPESLLARAELLRQIADLVIGLEEPRRTTVLLHFYEGQGVPAIAHRLNIDETTVRRRIRSALDQMRLTLDQSHYGNRGLWCGLLLSANAMDALGATATKSATACTSTVPATTVPFTTTIIGSGLGSTTSLFLGGIVMTGKTIVIVGTLSLVSLSLGFGLGRSTAGSRPEDHLTVGVDAYQELQSELTEVEQKRRDAERLVARFREKSLQSQQGTGNLEGQKAKGAVTGTKPRLSFVDLRRMLVAGNWNELAPTVEQIEATLKKHERDPAFLVAASLISDTERARRYVDEALGLDPDSPAALLRAVELMVSEGEFDETLRRYVSDLTLLDPGNSMGHYYMALMRFEEGETELALTALNAASKNVQLRDYSPHHLPTLAQFYQDAVGSPSMARALAMWGSHSESPSHLSRVADAASSELDSRLEQGHYREALEIARSLSQLGSKIAASDRILSHDLSGMSIEEKALAREMSLLRTLDETGEIELVENRIAQLHQLEHEFGEYTQQINELVASLNEQELVEFFERAAIEGESGAMRSVR